MDEHQVTHVNSHCVCACLLKLCTDVSGCINVQGRLLVVQVRDDVTYEIHVMFFSLLVQLLLSGFGGFLSILAASNGLVLENSQNLF